MMVKIPAVFVALLFALSLVGFVQVPTVSAAVLHHTYEGTVSSYDPSGNTLVVTGKDGERTFDLSNAKIKGNIRDNADVAVRYSDQNGQLVASSVKAQDRNREYGLNEYGITGYMSPGWGWSPEPIAYGNMSEQKLHGYLSPGWGWSQTPVLYGDRSATTLYGYLSPGWTS
jgi:hypothetical protein